MSFTVKQLKDELDKFNDDDIVLVEGKLAVTDITEASDESYLPGIISGGHKTYECEPNSWDSTAKFQNAKRCCLLTSGEYFLKIKRGYGI